MASIRQEAGKLDDAPTFEAANGYENQLTRNPRWAMLEGSRHFDENNAVFASLRGITKRLEDLQIPYAIVGGMAMFRHGFRRFTEDVDILVTRESLDRIHRELTGLGYLPPHAHSKHLRDTSTGVRIEFLVTGDFPGDGKEKPVAFPDPQQVGVMIDDARYVNLPSLIELKLASGMTGRGRIKDLADVQELIKVLALPRDFSDKLHPYVQRRFLKLWDDAKG